MALAQGGEAAHPLAEAGENFILACSPEVPYGASPPPRYVNSRQLLRIIGAAGGAVVCPLQWICGRSRPTFAGTRIPAGSLACLNPKTDFYRAGQKLQDSQERFLKIVARTKQFHGMPNISFTLCAQCACG